MTDDERATFRRWLDRPPPAGVRGEGTPWRAWFDGEVYLGWLGARPSDAVTADEKARQTADVAPGTTNGGEGVPEGGTKQP